jgi:hypothetical protein
MAEVNDRVFRGRAIGLGAAGVAVLGFAGLAIGLATDPARTWLSYVMAFVFAFTVSIGALIFLMIGYAANARWVAVVRRATEIVALPLPALAVLFVPILFGLEIYPWHAPGPRAPTHELAVLHGRAAYMNATGFAVRAAIYFAIVITAASRLRRWSRRRDAAPREAETARPDVEAALGRDRAFASAMLPPVGLALTFASFDWVMSLQPLWYSSIFGIYVFAGGFLAAIAAVTILTARSYRAGEPAITPNHFHALGRLLFAFTVFWAYSAFFQAMLIQIANKPDEVTFFLDRIGGLWTAFVYVLVLGHFALPFLILLPREIKFRPRAMATVAGWLVFVHLVDVYWLVIPSHVHGGMVLSWLDLAALAAVVGTAVAVAAWRQHGVPMIAIGDPCLPEGAAYRSPT